MIISVHCVLPALLLGLSMSLFATPLLANASKDDARATGLVRQLDKLRDKLQLRPDQQSLWDEARRKSIETQNGMRIEKHALIEFAETELDHPFPDLNEIARRVDAFEQRNAALQREIRDLWLKSYEVLSSQQKSTLRQSLKAELSRYKWLQNLRERFF